MANAMSESSMRFVRTHLIPRLLRNFQSDPQSSTAKHVVAYQSGGRAALLGIMHPASATHCSMSWRDGSDRINVGHRRVVFDEVGAKFPDVAVHVVKAPEIRQLLGNRSRSRGVGVAFISSVGDQVGVTGVVTVGEAG